MKYTFSTLMDKMGQAMEECVEITLLILKLK